MRYFRTTSNQITARPNIIINIIILPFLQRIQNIPYLAITSRIAQLVSITAVYRRRLTSADRLQKESQSGERRGVLTTTGLLTSNLLLVIHTISIYFMSEIVH